MSLFNQGEELLKDFLKEKKDIYVTSVTKEYLELAHNWFLSLKNIKSEHLAVVICFDLQSYEALKQKNIMCLFLETQIKNDTYEEWLETEKNIKLIGPFYIGTEYNVNIIYSDVDIVFFKDPLPKLKGYINEGYDFCVISDKEVIPFTPNRKLGINSEGETFDSKFGEECCSFCYIPPSLKNVEFWSSLLKKKENLGTGVDNCFQAIIAKKIKDNDIKCKILNLFEFPNGSVWRLPYLKEKIKDTCFLIHYNNGTYKEPTFNNQRKIEWIKTDKNWYVG